MTGTYIELLNLTETETYSVRVISQGTNASSLPSASVRFTTYPGEFLLFSLQSSVYGGSVFSLCSPLFMEVVHLGEGKGPGGGDKLHV